MGAAILFCLLTAPFCICSFANSAGADDGPGELLVWDAGETSGFVACVEGTDIRFSFIPSGDIAVGPVTVPAGSVPARVSPEEAGWTVGSDAGGFYLRSPDGTCSGRLFVRFVAEYQINGILPEEEALAVSVVWTLEIATIVELKITTEELYS